MAAHAETRTAAAAIHQRVVVGRAGAIYLLLRANTVGWWSTTGACQTVVLCVSIASGTTLVASIAAVEDVDLIGGGAPTLIARESCWRVAQIAYILIRSVDSKEAGASGTAPIGIKWAGSAHSINQVGVRNGA